MINRRNFIGISTLFILGLCGNTAFDDPSKEDDDSVGEAIRLYAIRRFADFPISKPMQIPAEVSRTNLVKELDVQLHIRKSESWKVGSTLERLIQDEFSRRNFEYVEGWPFTQTEMKLLQIASLP